MGRIAIKKSGRAYKTWGLATLFCLSFRAWVSLLPYPKGPQLPVEQTGVMSAACSGDKGQRKKIQKPEEEGGTDNSALPFEGML